MRMLINLSRAAMYIGLATLIGYYNFAINGWIGITTNACFFFLGILLITTWKSKETVEEQPVPLHEKHVEPVKVLPAVVEVAEDKTRMSRPKSWDHDECEVVEP